MRWLRTTCEPENTRVAITGYSRASSAAGKVGKIPGLSPHGLIALFADKAAVRGNVPAYDRHRVTACDGTQIVATASRSTGESPAICARPPTFSHHKFPLNPQARPCAELSVTTFWTISRELSPPSSHCRRPLRMPVESNGCVGPPSFYDPLGWVRIGERPPE